MNRIEIVSITERKKWDDLVNSFDDYDVYYLSGYVKAFLINGDGDPQLVFFENETTRAINVVFKRDVASVPALKSFVRQNEYFDYATPYGYGGFLVEGNDIDSLNREYTKYCIENHIVCEFVRYHPLLCNWIGQEGMYDQVHLGKTVCIDTSSEEIIWKNISSKNRNMIRKARKNGLKTYWCREPQIIKPFMSIYNQTMQKDEAADYYFFGENFYQSILEDLKDNAMWFYTSVNNEIAAISIIMFCNGNVHYHLSASKKEYMHLAPTNLLLYDVALWACHNGFTRMHLGGGVGSGDDSLYKFKKSFNRSNDLEFWIGKKIFLKDCYEKLMRQRIHNIGSINSNYFPIYRIDVEGIQ